MPDIYANSERYLHGLPGPRILKSHEPFDSRYPRVIYLTRDPRDVVLSYFHHQRKFSQIGNGYPFERFLDRFLAGTLDSYGSWRDNVFGWVARRHLEVGPIVHVVRYEDLIDTPVDALAGIAQFLSVDSSPERLDQTLGLSSVERMRALELSQRHSAPHIGGRHELSFLPQATKGGWRHLLPEGAAERIWSRWQGSMEFLGYR